jgi:hypothetical protein
VEKRARRSGAARERYAAKKIGVSAKRHPAPDPAPFHSFRSGECTRSVAAPDDFDLRTLPCKSSHVPGHGPLRFADFHTPK